MIARDITLTDCLREIDAALNSWYPTERNGADKDEREARHVRLFQFRDRLKQQLIGCSDHYQARAVASPPEPASSAIDSDEPEDREERCDNCGEVSRCLMRGLCPMCYELNGGTHAK